MLRLAPAVIALGVALTGCASSTAEQPMVSRDEFEQIFPHHSSFYSYDDFLANTHFDSRRDTAQFLANVAHETARLTKVEENPGHRAVYCDDNRDYGCPAGTNAYYGRGPLQLSWNYNYHDAGEALGLDLLHDPEVVSRDPQVAWRTAAWFWSTKVPHGGDFGATIRAINGEQECDGRDPGEMQSRVSTYRHITTLMDVPAGDGLTC